MILVRTGITAEVSPREPFKSTASPQVRRFMSDSRTEVDAQDNARHAAATRTARRLDAELPGDHHLLDLVGALADGEDLRVAVEAADRVLLDVAVAAVDLDGLL